MVVRNFFDIWKRNCKLVSKSQDIMAMIASAGAHIRSNTAIDLVEESVQVGEKKTEFNILDLIKNR